MEEQRALHVLEDIHLQVMLATLVEIRDLAVIEPEEILVYVVNFIRRATRGLVTVGGYWPLRVCLTNRIPIKHHSDKGHSRCEDCL